MLPALSLVTALFVQHAYAREEYYSQLKPCPVSCEGAQNPAKWTLYSSVERLKVCSEPVLFQVSLSAPVKAGQSTRVRACTAGDSENMLNSIIQDAPETKPDPSRIAKRGALAFAPDAVKDGSSVQVASWGTTRQSGSKAAADGLDILSKINGWITAGKDDKQPTAIFGILNGTMAAYYGGARVEHGPSAKSLLDKLSSEAKGNGVADRLAVQHCGETGSEITGGVTTGAILSTDGDFQFLQGALISWSKAKCPTGASKTTPVKDLNLKFYHFAKPNTTSIRVRDSECRYILVEQNDSCPKLAARCGITPAKYTEYNPGKDHCNKLRAQQPVCCGPGTVPDFRPDPNADGTCHSYEVKPLDTCDGLSAKYTLNDGQLMQMNRNTWGWTGCNPLGLGIAICLSKGKPPLPAAVDNAVCGPTKPGTKPPRGDQTLSDLNPCPLKVCCNVWGQCGTTDEFCLEKKSETGAPGTSGLHNGCIQNCGMDIVNKDKSPKEFRTLGYFEAWNYDRNCLHMDISKVKNHKRHYTDVHFSFAEISKDFDVVIPEKTGKQWGHFLKLVGDGTPRKIVAFGGWAFSTEGRSYQIFRDVVKPENRKAFAEKVVDFAINNDLDGIDFDWEYPGAPDIPGVPPGDKADGSNYLALLTEVRKLLPAGKTLSIAAPASFWYLKGFPIDRMEPLLDYIVYMTYDLHGQWDSGNPHSAPGCPAGNCLRSHVNWTETENALAMITKAGVPTSKILLGVSSYGRSFKMAEKGCTGPMCTYLGDKDSPAKKGPCTNTSGYISNAEIKDIIQTNKNVDSWYDKDTRSNYLVYDETEWVAWMDNNVRDDRVDFAKGTNFGGTIEWAIDLEDFVSTGDPIDVDDSDDDVLPACDGHYDTIDDLIKDEDNVDYWCAPQYLLDILGRELAGDLSRYDKIMDDGYDEYFSIYGTYIAKGSYKAASDFMFDHGKEWFNCNISEVVTCCLGCDSIPDYSCTQCLPPGECKIQSGNDDALRLIHSTIEECPPDYSKAGMGPAKYRDITWTLKDGKEDDFWAEIEAEVGIPKKKMELSDTGEYIYGFVTNTNCHYSKRDHDNSTLGDDGDDLISRDLARRNIKKDCMGKGYWTGAPKVDSRVSEDDVTNPKDTVKKALDKSSGLVSDLASLALEVKSGMYKGDAADLIDAVAMPIYMIREGLDYMDTVVEMAKKIEEAEKKTLIVNLLSAILFVVPALGEAIGTLGLATLGRALVTIGELGNTGLGIYSVVDNPKAAPIFIFGLVLSAKGIRDSNNVVKAAKARRAMPHEDIVGFSTKVAERLAQIDKGMSKGKGKAMCVQYA